MSDDSKQRSIRLTAEDRRILDQLARQLGINQTAVIKLAIRELALRRPAGRERGATR